MRTVSIRLQESDLQDCVLLYVLLMERPHKLWQIQQATVMMMVLETLLLSLFLSLQQLVWNESKAVLHL